MPPVSPIAAVTVLTAAVAVAVVAALQGEDAGRVRVVDAIAVPDQGDAGALRLYMTVINDGGDDRAIAFRSPASDTVALAAGAGDAPITLELPADSTQVLDADHTHLIARAVDPDKLDAAGFPLVIELERSDGIYLTVPLQVPGE